jgi:hypothetical protein
MFASLLQPATSVRLPQNPPRTGGLHAKAYRGPIACDCVALFLTHPIGGVFRKTVETDRDLLAAESSEGLHRSNSEHAI